MAYIEENDRLKGCGVCEAPWKQLGVSSIETQETLIKVSKSSISKNKNKIQHLGVKSNPHIW